MALAAGHLPCFFCRRADAQAFRAAWGKVKGGKAPLAPEIDAVLHEERLDRGRKRVHAFSGPVAELPDGAVIVAAGEAYTIAHGRAFLWSEQGYQTARQIRRADAQAFRAAWGNARGGQAPLAPEIDAVLHEERLDRGRKRVHAILDPVAALPDGAVIVAAGEAYTIAHGRAFLWSEQGYQAARQLSRVDGLLTPPSTLRAIRAGYRPVLHPDIKENLHS